MSGEGEMGKVGQGKAGVKVLEKVQEKWENVGNGE